VIVVVVSVHGSQSSFGVLATIGVKRVSVNSTVTNQGNGRPAAQAKPRTRGVACCDLLGVDLLLIQKCTWIVLEVYGHDDPIVVEKNSVREPATDFVE
jgi:hypothetical protein